MLWRWLFLGPCSSICLKVMHFLPKVLILYLASNGTKIIRNHFAMAIPNCTVPYNVCNWNECSWTQVYQMNWSQFHCKFKLHSAHALVLMSFLRVVGKCTWTWSVIKCSFPRLKLETLYLRSEIRSFCLWIACVTFKSISCHNFLFKRSLKKRGNLYNGVSANKWVIYRRFRSGMSSI